MKIKNWKQSILTKNALIKDVIHNLNKTKLKICMIEENQKLVGVITDGDIRRGLLKDLSLNDKVSKIIKKKPFTIKENFCVKKTIQLLDLKELDSVPIINKEKKIIGLYIKKFIDKYNQFPKTAVVIMAGGFGKRLMPITKKIPKPLVEIKNVPVIEKILLSFKNEGFQNFFIIGHYKIEMIINHLKKFNSQINIKFIKEKKPLGTAGGLFFLKKKKYENFIITNSDVLTSMNYSNFLKFHKQNKSNITIAGKKEKFKIPFGIINKLKDNLIDISEKPCFNFIVNAGIYILDRKIINKLSKPKHLQMTDLIKKIKDKKILKKIFILHENWIDIGSINDLKKANSNEKF
ncbi:sugar phosphate nucleotidyltransferase [Candidatus Pelagibacter sp.]|jgi:dTDP-glucose pyrophosphorylase|nr:sugar phosphate nucleotidyltransferase [Candidatus Pelagibacter sp.]